MNHTSEDLAFATRIVEREMGFTVSDSSRLGGTDSTNVRIRTSRGCTFVMKVMDEDVIGLAQAHCEHELLKFLEESSVRTTPMPLQSIDGRSVIAFARNGRRMLISVVHWVPGRAPMPVTPNRAALIGRTLGELSAALAHCTKPPKQCLIRYDMPRILLRPMNIICKDRELSRRYGARLATIAPKAGAFFESLADIRTGWLHGDAHLWNMRLHKGRICLLDFDEAGVGPYSWELAVPLYFVRAIYPVQCNELCNILTNAYCEVFPLVPKELAAVKVFTLLRSLIGMEYEIVSRSRCSRTTADIAHSAWGRLLRLLEVALDEWQ